ncbi:hypothetical protein KRMM14A1259_43080 [Krasilnikovia sp. MM14-A1259]
MVESSFLQERFAARAPDIAEARVRLKRMWLSVAPCSPRTGGVHVAPLRRGSSGAETLSQRRSRTSGPVVTVTASADSVSTVVASSTP